MDKPSRTLPSLMSNTGWRYVSTRIESVSTQHRQFFRFLCLATVCLAPMADSIGQQSVSAVTTSSVPRVPLLPASAVKESSWKSRENVDRHDSASDLLQAEKAARKEIDNRDMVPRPSQNRIANDFEARQRERAATLRQIDEQLQRLITQYRNREASETAEPKVQQEPEVPVQAPAQTASDDGTPVKQTADPPMDEPPENDDAGSIPLTVSTSTAPSPTDSVFADGAVTIVDGPVDRIGLADSLYALDELSIALEMYGKVDLKNVPVSERFWVSFQRACCLRRLNRISEAQELYRRMAGQQNAGWLAKMSRWWLDQIDARVELETQIKEHQKMLAALKESADDRTEQ